MSPSKSQSVRESLNSSSALPIEASQVTAEWCTSILGYKVKSLKITSEIHATASKIFVDLVYDDTAPADDKPTRVVFKGGFSPQLIALYPSLWFTYRREAEFYYHIAPTVNMRLPRAYWCGTDTVKGQGIACIDDLTAQGCTFGTPLAAWPVERVRKGVEQLAALHAKTWGAKPEEYPWIASDAALGVDPYQGVILNLLTPQAWGVRFAEGNRPPVPDRMANRERMERAFKTLWKTADPRLHCVVHGDPHLGNTFMTKDGEPGFIDYQGMHAGAPFHDVAYFMVGALRIGDRRKSEESLLSHYLESLAKMGGPRFEKKEVWDEYRKWQLSGFAWAICAPQMQPRDIIWAMTERHVVAIEDHKTLELLEELERN